MALKLNEAQRKLVADNHNLIYSFMHKYHYEEYDILAIGLCQAAIAYNGSTKFSTLAYKCMWNEMLKEEEYWKREMRSGYDEITMDGLLKDLIPATEKDYESVEQDDLIDYIMKKYCKNSEDRLIVKMTAAGYIQQEIADVLGCSRQKISLRWKKIGKLMKGETECI